MVILRNKSGGAILRIASEFSQGENSTGFFELDSKGLLQFLGVSPEEQIVKVSSDIELIAPVPFALSDGEGGGGVPAIPEGIAWVFSSFDLDRMGERIDPSGWDFSCYLKNPVIQWAHCFDIPAIGRAENIVADEKGLRGTIIFNGKEFDPFGWGIGERVKAGVIRAGSVGFRPIEIEIPSKKDCEDGTSLIFRKQELLEFSVCNVPANPYALATAR
jgi:HK97 family phage prohead protease